MGDVFSQLIVSCENVCRVTFETSSLIQKCGNIKFQSKSVEVQYVYHHYLFLILIELLWLLEQKYLERC